MRKLARQVLRRIWRIVNASAPAPAVLGNAANTGRVLAYDESKSLELPSDHLPVALIIDNRWPRPDRDAGSLLTVDVVDALIENGYRVIFAADEEFGIPGRDTTALTVRGVDCVGPADGRSVSDFLARPDLRIDLCVLNRTHAGGRFLEAVERYQTTAQIIFSPVDLHFLRLEREARLRGDRAALDVAAKTRVREEELVRAADATIVVSSKEKRLLDEFVPEAYVTMLPLARDPRPPTTLFGARRGIGFIGGFSHAPNMDALRFFLAEIWPLVIDMLPDCEFTIVGPDLPANALENVIGEVRYLGHVPDIDPWLASLRATVAPIRYGAGAKGKIATSLATGVPCVTTTMGAEGMSLNDGVDVLVADDPALFARRVYEVYSDQALWSRVSAGGLAYVGRELSFDKWRREFRTILNTIVH